MKKHPGARHGSPKETGRSAMSGGHVAERMPSIGPGDVGRFVGGAQKNTTDSIGLRDGASSGKGGRRVNNGDDD